MDIHSVVYFTNFTNVLNCCVKFYTANSGKIHSKVSGTGVKIEKFQQQNLVFGGGLHFSECSDSHPISVK